MTFKLYNQNNAPAGSQALLEGSIKAFGMVPNLHAVLAESPATLKAYQELHQLFSDSSFDAAEKTVVWQTINVEHGCHYCIPAHTAIAHMMQVDQTLIDALRNKTAMPTDQLQTLHDTTLTLVRNRGHLSEAERAAFFAAGYGNQQLLEIVLGISQKVISNYVNHLADTPIDEPFQKYA